MSSGTNLSRSAPRGCSVFEKHISDISTVWAQVLTYNNYLSVKTYQLSCQRIYWYFVDQLGRCDSTNCRLVIVALSYDKLVLNLLHSGFTICGFCSDRTLPNRRWLSATLHIVSISPTVDQFRSPLLRGLLNKFEVDHFGTTFDWSDRWLYQGWLH